MSRHARRAEHAYLQRRARERAPRLVVEPPPVNETPVFVPGGWFEHHTGRVWQNDERTRCVERIEPRLFVVREFGKLVALSKHATAAEAFLAAMPKAQLASQPAPVHGKPRCACNECVSAPEPQFDRTQTETDDAAKADAIALRAARFAALVAALGKLEKRSTKRAPNGS